MHLNSKTPLVALTFPRVAVILVLLLWTCASNLSLSPSHFSANDCIACPTFSHTSACTIVTHVVHDTLPLPPLKRDQLFQPYRQSYCVFLGQLSCGFSRQ
ncbi:hypothetical protein BGW80DRAFT_1314885 [Lactifluus volemus]|nr:hypothetical protein BGW80DRAFT_1314885 [Lactifluus volemus]